ncbi:cation/H(+) antiporter 20 isoform X2 [Abrus precatorius]|nr:cation/H(+) antiporter 20 isoform X2 [Abrus precatorius]
MNRIFPSWSTPTLESVASIGLLFFLFLVGLELDLNSIRRSGRRAFSIAAVGISLPFVCGIGVAIVLRKTVDGADKVGFAQFLVFMGVALSITAFPVLARILAELKLFTTRVGETAMAAAAFNDVAAWILLALAVAISGDGNGGNHKSPLISVWVLLSGLGFVVFMFVVIRPAMKRVARWFSMENDAVDEAYICLILGGVMVSGFVTDFIGIHSIFGAFVFGLTVPKDGNLVKRLIERIEDFVLGLLLPLYFASSGLKTDITTIRGAEAWGLLCLVIFTACAGKILGTFIVAVFCMIPARESLTLGVLMNTKGLVELIVLNIGKEKKVLNNEMFAILVLMALVTTFITTPIVMAIYKPARGTSGKSRRRLGNLSFRSKDEALDKFRVLACIHGPSNIPSIINFIESIRSTKKSFLKLFMMHLVELTERSSSIILVQRARRNGFPFFSRFHRDEWHDRLAGAFQGYSQLGQVTVRSTTAISSLSTMHEDICHVAEEKWVTMIILPFHKQWRVDVGDDNVIHHVLENAGHEWRGVNQKVLQNAPCSVAILVDRGYGNSSLTPSPNTTVAQRVCIVFFGGPDDREALELGKKMSQHPTVRMTVLRFVEIENDGFNGNNLVLNLSPNDSCDESYSFSTATFNRHKEKELDEKAIGEFRSIWDERVEFIERVSDNVVEDVLEIGKSGNYDLIIVGKGRFPSNMVAGVARREAEHAELGPIGDILTSSEHDVVSSVLVVQQHDFALVDEAPVCKEHRDEYKHHETNDDSSLREEGVSIANDNIV